LPWGIFIGGNKMRDMKSIHRASLFASLAHLDQKYGREPYFVHLQAVADMTIRLGGDDIAEQVAWLHDVIEDTDVTSAILLLNFPAVVVLAVEALTKREGWSYEGYIEKVKSNPIALLVKKADTLCNLTQSTLQGNRKRIMKYTTQLQLLTEE
jgi:(p)ppGpp synthase/HD superfamily hydrolase